MATSQRTWQPENQEPNHGNTRVLRYSLCKLISAIVSHLNHLTSEQRMESLTTRQPTEESKQLWKTLNWEYPGGAEYTCITRTLEKQKELLQHMYRQGEDTSQKELLVQLLRKIWKYIQLSKFTRMGLSSSLHHQDEWKLFVLPNKGDESDTFQQQVEKLLSFLKNEMAEYDTQVLDHSRNNEESLLQEFNSSYTHQEL